MIWLMLAVPLSIVLWLWFTRPRTPKQERERQIKVQTDAYWRHIRELEREHKRHQQTWAKLRRIAPRGNRGK